MTAATSPAPLWRDRAFVRFWIGRMVSILGSTVTAVVLPILVYQRTGSALLTGLLAAVGVVPYLLFGLPAGALADRLDRRRLMVGCDLGNAGLLATIPVAAAAGVLTLPQLFVVEFLSATLFVWFDAANFGALPALVGRERIVAANSAIWSAGTIIGLIGPAVGGALAAGVGPAAAILLDAASYAFSALALLGIPRAFRTNPVPARACALAQTLRADIGEGLTYLWQQPLVRALTLLGVGVSLTGGGVTGLLVVYAVRGLGLPATDARIGLLFSAGAVGALAASLLLPRLVRRVTPGRITLAGLVLNPLLLVGVALAPGFGSALVLYALWDACYTLIIINGIALRQMVIPDALQSRVNATARMIAWGGAPFGAVIGGLLAEALPVRLALIGLALFFTTSAAIGWFAPLREPLAPLPASILNAAPLVVD